MDLVLINLFEIAVVRRSEDWVHDVPPNDLGYSLSNPLLDADCRKAEEVLPIGFFLRISVVIDLWFNDTVVGASAFSGRSRCCEHVSLLDVYGDL